MLSNNSIACEVAGSLLQLKVVWLLPCRGIIEHNISEVARGRRPKEAVLEEAVQHFRGDYVAAAQKQGQPCFPLQPLLKP